MKHRVFGQPKRIRCAIVLLGLASAARAQERTITTTDAAVLPRGTWLFRTLSSWTRYDQLYGVAGGSQLTSLGSFLTTDSLNAARLAPLALTETAVQQLSTDPTLRLSAGGIRTAANSRIVVVPLRAEYGLRKHLTISLLVPIVQARTTVVATLNASTPNSANVGLNPSAFFGDATAQMSNASVTDALLGAAAQLDSRLAECTTTPTVAGCSALLARRSEAEILVREAADFSSAAVGLYGVSAEQPGLAFVPLAGSDAEKAIGDRLSAFRTSFTSFGISAGSGSLTGAGGPAGTNQLQALVHDPRLGIGRDTIGASHRLEVGDVEIGATWQIMNDFPDSLVTSGSPGKRLRAAVQGIVRLGTGRPARPGTLFDVDAGNGQNDVEVRGALDVMTGRRWITTATGAYVYKIGTPPPVAVGMSPFPLGQPQAVFGRMGNSFAIHLMPRFVLTHYVMVNGFYAFRHQGVSDVLSPAVSASNEHSAGLGLSYSTVALHTPGSSGVPMEVSYNHAQTLTASGGPTPKSSRDQIELRIYWRRR